MTKRKYDEIKSSPHEAKINLDERDDSKLVIGINPVEVKDEAPDFSHLDRSISKIWLDAAELALKGNVDPLFDLFNSPDRNPEVIDWNIAVQEGIYQGMTLAYIAVKLNAEADKAEDEAQITMKALSEVLLNSPQKNLNYLDWNARPHDPSLGANFALYVAKLYVFNDDACKLYQLLVNSPSQVLDKLDWLTVDEDGVNLGWIAAMIFYVKGKSKLLKNLYSPDLLSKLDLNMSMPPLSGESPAPNHVFTVSFIWLVTRFACYSVNSWDDLLYSCLESSDKIRDWGSRPLGSATADFNRSLAFMATSLYLKKEDESELYDILVDPETVIPDFLWNCLVNEGIDDDDDEYDEENEHQQYKGNLFYRIKGNLSWQAAEVLIKKNDPRLIKKLFSQSVEVLRGINWHVTQNPTFLYDYSLWYGSCAEIPAFLRVTDSKTGQNEALDAKLLGNLMQKEQTGDAYFFNISLPHDSSSSIVGSFVYVNGDQFSRTEEFVLESKISSPLTAIFSDNLTSEPGKYNRIKYEEKTEITDNIHCNLFAIILSLVPDKLDWEEFKRLISLDIFGKINWSTIYWSDALKTKIFDLIDEGVVEFEKMLIGEKRELLEKLLLATDRPDSVSYQYLNLLLNIRRGTALDSDMIAFGEKYPLKLLACYESRYRDPLEPYSEDKGAAPYVKAEFELASWYLTAVNLYADGAVLPEIKEKLQNSHERLALPAECKDYRQVLLRNAFSHACEWYYKSCYEENQDFILRIVAQLFAGEITFPQKPPGRWTENTLKFLKKIDEEDLNSLASSIKLFLMQVNNAQLSIRINKLKKERQQPMLKLPERSCG